MNTPLTGEEWRKMHARHLRICDRRNGVALGICDMVDQKGFPVAGKPLRRLRRLDRLARAIAKRLYSHPLRAETPPLGGVDG